MPIKPIDSTEFTKNIKAMVSTLTDRAEAFQRFIVSEVADEAAKQLRARVPHDKDVPADYQKELQVVKVGNRDASYAIVYRGKPAVVSDYDPERTVLYIHLMDPSDTSPEAMLFSELSRFQPFTMDTMPLDVPRDTAFVVARLVTKAETDLIRKRANRMRGRIQKVVDVKGKGVTSKKAFDRNTALLFNDLAFQVLRKELGIGLSKKPHWRPALKHVQNDNTFIKKLMMSDDSLRLWNDPEFRGWMKFGTLEDEVSESSVDDLDDFQKQVIPRGGP